MYINGDQDMDLYFINNGIKFVKKEDTSCKLQNFIKHMSTL